MGRFDPDKGEQSTVTGRPQLTQPEQEGVAVVGVLNRVAHQPNAAVPARPLRVPDRRTGQAGAGTHFDENPVLIGKTSSSSANLIVERI